MRRILGAYAYGPGPRTGCWWDETCRLPEADPFEGGAYDVVVVGGGFTGVAAALVLARAGAKVAVFEAAQFGWGASGRNGGFCCLGGGIASDRQLDARFGKAQRLAFRSAEAAAVAHVDAEITALGLDVDRHSEGETELAHRPRTMDALRRRAHAVLENYHVEPKLLERADLGGAGFGGGPFHGALTIPIGFALNPRKYLTGLLRAARDAGALLHDQTCATGLSRTGAGYRIETNIGDVRAKEVVFATNGYSSEDVPNWFSGRYMPAQSTVLVTRPLSDHELADQGWTTGQMSYDTRSLLHYFRLMPDRRFLFGMRGGLGCGPGAELRSRARTRAHFERLFPRWAGVETTHSWSGFVAIARSRMPYVGGIPDMPGAWAALCYHGNGVAMGSYAGRLLAEQVLGHETGHCPEVMRQPLIRFPLGRWRRALMPPIYAQRTLADIL